MCRDVRNFEFNHSPARATGAHYTAMVGAAILTPDNIAEINTALKPCIEFALGDETTAGLSKRRAENAVARSTKWLRAYLDKRHSLASASGKPETDCKLDVAKPIAKVSSIVEHGAAASLQEGGNIDTTSMKSNSGTESTEHVRAAKRARLSGNGGDVQISHVENLTQASDGGPDHSAADTGTVGAQQETRGPRISAVGCKDPTVTDFRGKGNLQEGELQDGGWVVGTVCGHAVANQGRNVAQKIATMDSELAGTCSRKTCPRYWQQAL